MPASVSRTEFLRTLGNSRLDVDDVQADARLRHVLPQKADVDGDGAIAGHTEIDALFTQIDSFGRDPSAQRAMLVTPQGRPTDAARALAALGDVVGSAEVLGWTADIDFSSQTDWSAYIPPTNARATAEAVVGAAARLVREHANHYGTKQPWFNLDPHHALPAGRELGGLGATSRNPDGVWKCNLFGGNALHLAGFEPPYYGNRGGGEYANANQFWKFSDKYAAQFGNKAHFEMVSELKVDALPYEERGAAIAALLQSARPGDLIMVDHLGTEVADGGHTRVVMANELRADGSGVVHSAQATLNAATVRAEGVSAFTNEEHIWILRPNRPRGGSAPQPTPGPSPAPAGRTYTVQAGDTLSKIAARELGSASRWPEILRANPEITDPRRIRPGMQLALP